MSHEVTLKLERRWYTYLRQLVDDRRFPSIDDAVEDALRLLEATEEREERLARLLLEGEHSGDAGSWDLRAFLTAARERDAVG